MAKKVSAPPPMKAKMIAKMSNVLSRDRTVPGMRLYGSWRLRSAARDGRASDSLVENLLHMPQPSLTE